MNEEALRWIYDYVPTVMLLSLVIAIVRFKNIREHCSEMLYYVGMVSFFEVFTRVLAFRKMNNLMYIHLYTWLEFIIISFFFLRLLSGFVNRNLLLVIMAGFTIFAFGNAFFIQGIESYNSYTRTLECLLIIVGCLTFYFRMLSELSIKDPLNSTDFWVTTAFFVYFTGSFILFILSDLLLSQSIDLQTVAWSMHSFLLAVLHILLSIGLWKTPRLTTMSY